MKQLLKNKLEKTQDIDILLGLSLLSLIILTFFIKPILTGIIGLALGIATSYRWGFKKGIFIGGWLIFILGIGLALNPDSYQGIDTLINIAVVVIICIIAGKVGEIVEAKQIKLEKSNQELKQQKEELEVLFENSTDAIVKVNKNNEIITCNNQFFNTFGYDLKEAEGENLDDILVGERNDSINQKLAKKVLAGQKLVEEGVRFDKEGNQIEVLIKEVPIKINEKILGAYVIYEDISDRKAAKRKIKEQKNLLDNILESIQDGISVLDSELNVKYTNGKMKKWYEDNLPLKGKKCFQVYRNRESSCDRCPSLKAMKTGKVEKEVIENPIISPAKYLEIFSYPIQDEKTDEITGVVEFIRDITARKEAEEEIKYISFHDELTNLYNRSYLEEEMKRLDTSRQLPISIIMIDINGLKLINDTFGHNFGDELLQKGAKVLEKSFRKEDIIARFGGDEFTILLPKADRKVAEKLKRRLEKNFQEVASFNLPLSASIGVATKTKASQDLWEVRKKADAQMYQNKFANKKEIKNKIIRDLIKKLESKSSETKEHLMEMQRLCFQFGEKLDLSLHELEELSILATLHDIGKIAVDKEILTKADSLNNKEWKEVKRHSKTGYRITSATEEFAYIANEILYHHERWDGNGYPEGLKEGEIPLLSRIISIVDAYVVMKSGRPYQKAMSKEECVQELKKEAGKQFDPDLVEEFLEII